MSDAPAPPTWHLGQCKMGRCLPSPENTGVRCARHAALWARHTMEKRGWVCIHDYGQEAGAAVDRNFLTMVTAVHDAGVELQRWMSGWDDHAGTVRMGVWAPRVVAAILGTVGGKLSASHLAQALKRVKLDPNFASAVDAAWRLGGSESAILIIMEQLPHIAAEINATAG